MANQFRLFNEAVPKFGNGTIDLDSDTIKWAFITDAYTPDATDANPCWGSGGTTDLSVYEVTPGGTYPAGGVALTSVTYAQAGGTTTFDSDDLSLSQDPSNPVDARWLVLYDDTAAAKDALGFADLDGLTDLSSGGFVWAVPSTGWFYFARAVE